MSAKTIDAPMLRRMFLCGAKNLEANKNRINELNVFPVPDGDTGTNMTLTILSAANEVQKLDKINMEGLAKAISSGSLRGARGNSGVILSQLLRGFTREFHLYKELGVAELAKAAQRAVDTAYKAVIKPKEGTILTVARGMAEHAVKLAEKKPDMDIGAFLGEVIDFGDHVLSKTPDLLPVLKEAGVVDSGGQGLMQVMKGALDGYAGRMSEDDILLKPEGAGSASPRAAGTVSSAAVPADIKYGYCTEFIINLEKKFEEADEELLKGYLASIGDSLVVVSDGEVVKIHVHTNDPGLAIQKGLSYGSLSRMKIDNMREEHRELLMADAAAPKDDEGALIREGTDDGHMTDDAGTTSRPAADAGAQEAQQCKDAAFIAVAVGNGIADIFRSLGADGIIEGGQTMNPSTDDFLNAIENVNAKSVFLLPNNGNIILAAQQAAGIAEGVNVYVVPSTTIPQGITALINYSPVRSDEDNLRIMSGEIQKVRTGEVTYAVRNTCIDGRQIDCGDIIAISGKSLLAVSSDVGRATMDMLSGMIDANSELVGIYYGEETDPEDAGQLLLEAQKAFPHCEIELNYGGQPIYYYIVSVE